MKALARAASNAGGKTTAELIEQRQVMPATTSYPVLDDAASVRRVLSETIGKVGDHLMRPAIANSIFYGVSVAIRLAELELDARLARLERLMARHSR